MGLFAERGFGATAVADIEEHVGLQPRRGGMYKHFETKQALLEAAVSTYVERAATVSEQITTLDLNTAEDADESVLRSLVTSLGRWFLDEMDRLKILTRILEHDSQRLEELVSVVKDDIVDVSYRVAATLIRAVAPGAADPDGTAVVILGSLVALRRTAWTFGSPPLDLDDDRALRAWTDATLAVLDAARAKDRPRPRRR
jgi:AcrR family transcriptional regulator